MSMESGRMMCMWTWSELDSGWCVEGALECALWGAVVRWKSLDLHHTQLDVPASRSDSSPAGAQILHAHPPSRRSRKTLRAELTRSASFKLLIRVETLKDLFPDGGWK